MTEALHVSRASILAVKQMAPDLAESIDSLLAQKRIVIVEQKAVNHETITRKQT